MRRHLLIISIIALLPLYLRGEKFFRTHERTYHSVPVEMTDSALKVDLSIQGPVTLEARVAMDDVRERHGRSLNYWGMLLVSGSDSLCISLRHGNSDFGDISDRRLSWVTLSRGGKILNEVEAKGFGASSKTFNSLRLDIDPESMSLKISGGDRALSSVLEMPLTFLPSEISLWCKGKSIVSSFVCEKEINPALILASEYSYEELVEKIKRSTDPVESFWEYLDRENDTRYARPGGRYLLATVKNEDNGAYDIIYISGAEIYPDKWQPMMKKGRLTPTIFENHYDLQWLDSSFESIDRDIYANITDGAILSLSFPLLKTTLRFSKLLKTPDYKKAQTDKED